MTECFPQPGRDFEKKYRIVELLGSGGFARVYLAEQIDLGRMVAIKVLSPQVSNAVEDGETDPKIEAVALRFEREAKVVSQLKCPETITIYDYGQTADGLLYMVMEFVDGIGLDEMSVPVEPRRVVKIIKQILRSLQEAHSHGLLHRDLKPANIMVFEHLGETDQVKLLDFGIAKAVDQAANDHERDLTARGSLVGTPRYMSPEQIRGDQVGAGSDIYSLGLVAYELLVGTKAITNSDSIEILGKHLSDESFDVPRQQKLHPKLRQLINKMVAKDPQRRYRSAQEVLADVAHLEGVGGDLRGDSSLPVTGRKEPTKTAVHQPDGAGRLGAFGQRIRRHPNVFVGVALVLLAGGGLVVVALLPAPAVFVPETDPSPPAGRSAGSAELARAGPAVGDARVTVIRSQPRGAQVWLGDRLVGTAPVRLDSADYDFPLTVRVQVGDRSTDKTLQTPGGEVKVKVAKVAGAAGAEADENAGDAHPKADGHASDNATADDAKSPTKPSSPPSQRTGRKPHRDSPAHAHRKSAGRRPKAGRDEPRSGRATKPSTAESDDEAAKDGVDARVDAKKEVKTRKYLPLE